MDLARLHYMANQIARNFAVQGDKEAIAATCDHLKRYWDPRMREQIMAGDRTALERIAKAAVDRLAQG
jgi:formate dehydrogenase subunit delta